MYAELHAHSCFSILDGASQPEELVARAAALGMPALALTDHDAVYGAHRFLRAAREHGIRPILGAELTLAAGEQNRSNGHVEHHLTLLVENQAGWHNLCYLISRARAHAPKGQAALPLSELEGCTGGLIALSGCRQGAIATALVARKWREAVRTARRYCTLFGPRNFWIELQNHRQPHDALLMARLADLARFMNLGCVATNNVHYAQREGHRLQDVLVCIRHNTTLDQASHLRRYNSEYYLKSPAQMQALFADYPEAVANTLRLAERCDFEPVYGLQDLPRYETPGGMSAESYLRRLCEQGLRERYGEPSEQARAQLQRELDVIARTALANYFLIVWDIVRFARENGIRCQGRGSAANSLAAYLLRISPIDPLQHHLVFERFLSEERLSSDAGFMPDIDLDFDAARREEVIQYVYKRYGAAHVAMACTFSTFQRRSALRDVGKALGLSPQIITSIQRNPQEALAQATDSSTTHLLQLAEEIEGLPRHLGIHAGGMVITGAPLMGRLPTEPATMENRIVVQWDKEGLEDAGLVKIDVLGLRMLSVISDTLQMLAQQNGSAPDLDALTYDDPAIYKMISSGDTIGIFQVESRAQTQLQPVLQPRCFDDLVVSISLIRPGPIQGNMVHPYLRRRRGVEPISYAHPLLKPALEETLGIILFQEQVLKVARDLAGFTPGQGEMLRRALGSKQGAAALEKLRDDFMRGALHNGVPRAVAEAVFEQLAGFGGFSFAKSHAASFAVLVYQSAWLRHYHFLPFMTALLNNQPMGFWSPSVIAGEVKRKGAHILPVDLSHSHYLCTLEEGGIRLGFNYVKGMGQGQAQRIVEQREQSPFDSLLDFWQRTRLGRRVTENLIAAGALDSWGIPRRHLLWELGTLPDRPDPLALDVPASEVELPALSAAAALLAEQSVLGLSAGEHIMAHVRPRLVGQGILNSSQLADCHHGQPVRVAGLVVVHQSPPTANGVHFVTLEDEHGLVDIIIWPQVYRQHSRLLHTERLLKVIGKLQREGGSKSVIAEHLVSLDSSQLDPE